MKRKTTLALVLALALLMGSMPALAVGKTLVNSGGIELQLLEFSIFTLTDQPSITLKLRGVNNTGHKVWVDFKDVKVDGVPVIGSTRSLGPYTDTGEDDPMLYSVWGSDVDHGAGYAAIKNGRLLELRVDVQDNETFAHLINEKLTIDLTQPVGGKAAPSSPSSSTGSSSGGSSGGAPAYTPASQDYKTLKRGSRGQAVRDLQQRLTDLGYLNDKVDGVFGQNTATAVMSFCTQNGLDIQGEATAEMQRKLYAAGAEYYEEPWVPMMFGPRYKWNNPRYASLDNGTFYIQVVNRSAKRTIRAYELYYYKTDVWGNRYVEPSSGIAITQKTTMQQTIKPGYIVYTPPITILPFSWTYTVWVGIHKIVFDDGEIREVNENDISYFGCTIKK